MPQETHSNFLEFFCKKIKMHRGSGSKNRGKHNKKIQENQKKPKAHGYTALTHAA